MKYRRNEDEVDDNDEISAYAIWSGIYQIAGNYAGATPGLA
jgi:hypothetical protein